MTGLREHFTETAERAKHYDVTRVVIRRARRRRQATQAIVAGAVAAVVVSTGLALTQRTAPEPASGVEVVDASGRVTDGRLDWLPPTVDARARLTPLPADHGVGPGALVYLRQQDYKRVLLTSAGESYEIPGETRGLSPDGRWLAYSADGHLVLRCLLDTQTRRLPDDDIKGWSAVGATAVYAPARPDEPWPSTATVMDPDTDTTRDVAVPDPGWWEPLGLAASGELMLGVGTEFPATVEPPPTAEPVPTPSPAATLIGPPRDLGFGIGFVNTASGRARSIAFLAADLPIAADERWVARSIWPTSVRVDTGGLVFQLSRVAMVDGREEWMSGDLVELNPESGTPVRRFQMPRSTPGGPTDEIVGTVTEGILLAHSPKRFDSPASRLDLLDPVTGARRTVFRIPAGVEILSVRGGNTSY